MLTFDPEVKRVALAGPMGVDRGADVLSGVPTGDPLDDEGAVRHDHAAVEVLPQHDALETKHLMSSFIVLFSQFYPQ